jgi:PEP-CTERM motif
MLGTHGTVGHSGLNSRRGRLALRAGVVGMALIFLPAASFACRISISTKKIANSTEQEVTVRAIPTDDLQCFMNKIDLTYTKPDGTAGSMSDTIGAAGTVTFKITAKAGTNINAQNVTETPNTFDKTKAVAFNPPMNRVESVYLVNAGSSVTFGGNTFNVSGGYTVIDTNIDYSTGAETGHLAAVDIDASGQAGTVLFTLSGTPAFDVNLSPIWAEPTLPATVTIPTDVAIAGTLSVNGSSSPFTGTLTDSTTYYPDGSQTDVDTLAFSTNFGSLTGTISATATPVLVPEPSTWVLFGSGLLALGAGRRLSGPISLFRLS